VKRSFEREPPIELSSLSITAIVIVLAVVIVTYLVGGARRRCPYRSPLCRRSKPCLLCYRDLFKSSVTKRGKA
jgi:hypothetical protein